MQRILNRFKAERGCCLFVDNVSRREVWEWHVGDKSWMGQSRFGFWVSMDLGPNELFRQKYYYGKED